MDKDVPPRTAAWPVGGGEMGARIRAFDWQKTPLGPIFSWPQSLKTTIDLVMASQLGMNLIWGPERIQIYNDANRAFMGTKHPGAFGHPAREHWGEVWEAAEAIHHRVFAGETVTLEDNPWTLVRNGRPEDTFFTSYFTPIRDETGAVAGNLVVGFETTNAVNARREHERLEQERRESETRLRTAAELVGLGWFYRKPSSREFDWDARAKAIWGLSPNAPVDLESMIAAVHPDDRPKVGEIKAAAADRATHSYKAEYRVIGIEDGVERWVRTYGQAFYEQGHPKAFLTALLDITEQKRIEQKLRDEETRLQAAVDLVGLGLYSWDPQTNALEWDARVKAIWGLPPSAHVDHDVWRQGVHPNDLARVEAEIAKCADPNGDGVYRIEYRVNGSDGVERWVVTRGRTTFRAGRPVGFVGVAIDITDRKHSEARLLESEARLSGILQQLPVGVGLVDREGRFLLRGGLLGGLWTAFMPSQDPGQNPRWRSYHPDGRLLRPTDYPGARALGGETVLPGTDFVYTADDGHETWIRVSAAPFRNAAGEIEGAVAILQDVDAEKRTEQAMRESEERFRRFAEHSSNVLWILDADTRTIEYLSPAYDPVWGQQTDATRNYWLQAVHPDDRDRTAAGLERALQGELVVQEYRIVRPDNKVRSIRDTMFPIRDRNGGMRCVGGIAQEISIHDGLQTYIINPNARSQEDLSRLLQRAGYVVKAFTSAAEFLQMAPVLAVGCVVLDIRSSYAGGLEVLRQLKERGSDLPVVVTGASNGDVMVAVQVMKAGAADWLEMPYEDDSMLMAVASALAGIRRSDDQHKDTELARVRVASMSVRERQVLEGLLAGGTNKMIGRELGISPRTVELHRASVMERLGVRTLPEAVLMAAAAGVRPSLRSRKARSTRKSP